MSYRDWLTSNLAERETNRELDFALQIKPYKFHKMSFCEAVKYTTELIYGHYTNLYLALSGGYDSEFVLKSFVSQNIPIKPIIVKTSANQLETSYAEHACKKWDAEPIILNCPDDLYLAMYSRIVERFNTIGISEVASAIAGSYAIQQGGTIISGNHLMEDGPDTVINCDVNEWDFWNEILYPEKAVTFFNYTLELAYATVNKMNGSPLNDFKHSLYVLDFRPKIRPQWSLEFLQKMRAIEANTTPVNRKVLLGHRDEVLKCLQS